MRRVQYQQPHAVAVIVTEIAPFLLKYPAGESVNDCFNRVFMQMLRSRLAFIKMSSLAQGIMVKNFLHFPVIIHTRSRNLFLSNCKTWIELKCCISSDSFKPHQLLDLQSLQYYAYVNTFPYKFKPKGELLLYKFASAEKNSVVGFIFFPGIIYVPMKLKKNESSSAMSTRTHISLHRHTHPFLHKTACSLSKRGDQGNI
jgi:hypothetical protein